jgi:hypothetical protein
MTIPTREELYEAVDREFRSSFPDAPLKLSRSGAHAEWRTNWLIMRDWLLNDTVNRVYWERYPDAPLKIDPENPDHNPYVNGWLEIRDAIMSSSPLPPEDDDDERGGDREIDMSHVRADLNQILIDLLPQIDSEYHDDLRDSFEHALGEIRFAAEVGTLLPGGDSWRSEEIVVGTAEGGFAYRIVLQGFWEGGVLRAASNEGPKW